VITELQHATTHYVSVHKSQKVDGYFWLVSNLRGDLTQRQTHPQRVSAVGAVAVQTAAVAAASVAALCIQHITSVTSAYSESSSWRSL
jgi:hypothetical protein